MGRKVAVGLQGSQVIRVGYEGLNQGFDRVGGALVHGVVVVEVPLHALIIARECTPREGSSPLAQLSYTQIRRPVEHFLIAK